MKNRHGISYDFHKISQTRWEFVIEESEMQYMRFGAKAGQEQPDMSDLRLFDPSGGPIVAVGTELPFGTVRKISCEDGRIFMEVEA